ncbi:MAG: succinate dehydrogenase, hydrophobic membrane anchor protein [Rhizobiaceae bacterium]
MSDFRTSAKKVRGSGSAKEGTTHFWRQRMTALANIPLLLFFIGFVVSMNGATHAEMIAAMSNPFTALVLIAVMISALIHMRLGMQVVIEDYIHGEGTKVILLALNSAFTFAVGLIALFAILKISFGA